MITKNPYDQDDLRAFVLNESRITTDDRELDEHSPEAIFGFDNESVHPFYNLSEE